MFRMILVAGLSVLLQLFLCIRPSDAWVRGKPRTLVSATGVILTAATKLSDGQNCYYNAKGVPLAPFCPGNKYNCVVKQVPNLKVQVYSGTCNSKYQSGSYCQFNSIPFAVGAKNIRTNSLCNSCNCNYIQSLAGPNKGACTCNPLPPCFVDYNGKPRGRFRCPAKQALCIITKPGGGGKDARGLPVDKGRCIYSGIGSFCATGGPSWGPKFYMQGVSGVPKSNNRCIRCACSASGQLTKCKAVKGCKVR